MWFKWRLHSNPISAHSMHDLSMSLIKVSASVGDIESLDVIKQLEIERDPVTLPALACSGGADSHRVKIRRDILKQI